MKKLHFPDPFKHKRVSIQDTNKLFEDQLKRGQRIADWFAAVMGSWTFIIAQTIILMAWAGLNVAAWIRHWDPYPFILMNLVISIQAAYAAPIIMMNQNRQAERDRLEAHNDYLINKKAEEEVRAILDHNSAQNDALLAVYERILKIDAGLEGFLSQNTNINDQNEKRRS